MTTNSEVLTAGLRKINVIPEGGTLSAEQGLTLLPILNDMIEEWTEREIEIGYFAQSDTTQDCPIPKWAESAVKANLGAVIEPRRGAGRILRRKERSSTSCVSSAGFWC